MDELRSDLDRGESDRRAVERDGDSRGIRDRIGSRIRSPFGGLFRLRRFLLALGLSVVGLVLSGFVPLLPAAVSALAGVFLAGFSLGLVSSKRAYTEVALAGAATAAVATLADYLLVTALGGFGVPLAALTGGAGVLASVGGHYFGRDLRSGLTRDV